MPPFSKTQRVFFFLPSLAPARGHERNPVRETKNPDDIKQVPIRRAEKLCDRVKVVNVQHGSRSVLAPLGKARIVMMGRKG
jgi:hypothetical protein